jgi:hypothetical protein
MPRITDVFMKSYLDELDLPIRKLVKSVRRNVLEAAPELEEIIKWGNPAYEKNGLVCAIVPHKDHVNLQFFSGKDLSDPDEILEGTGKSMRHVKISGSSNIKDESLRALVKVAVKRNKE